MFALQTETVTRVSIARAPDTVASMWPGYFGMPPSQPQAMYGHPQPPPMYPQPRMMPGMPPMGFSMHPQSVQMTAQAGYADASAAVHNMRFQDIPIQGVSDARTPRTQPGRSGAQRRALKRQASARCESEEDRSPPRFKDDSHGISSSFKTLGLHHVNGPKRCMSQLFRCSLINCADPRRWPMMRLAQMEEEAIDMMLWIVCGIAPHTKPSHFGCDCKAAVRRQSKEQSDSRRASQPGRLNLLSEDWDNVPAVAMKLGDREEWLLPSTFAAWDRACRRREEASFSPPATLRDHPESSPDAPRRAPPQRPLALECDNQDQRAIGRAVADRCQRLPPPPLALADFARSQDFLTDADAPAGAAVRDRTHGPGPSRIDGDNQRQRRSRSRRRPLDRGGRRSVEDPHTSQQRQEPQTPGSPAGTLSLSRERDQEPSAPVAEKTRPRAESPKAAKAPETPVPPAVSWSLPSKKPFKSKVAEKPEAEKDPFAKPPKEDYVERRKAMEKQSDVNDEEEIDDLPAIKDADGFFEDDEDEAMGDCAVNVSAKPPRGLQNDETDEDARSHSDDEAGVYDDVLDGKVAA